MAPSFLPDVEAPASPLFIKAGSPAEEQQVFLQSEE